MDLLVSSFICPTTSMNFARASYGVSVWLGGGVPSRLSVDCAMMGDDLGNIQSVTLLHGWMRLKPIVDPVIT